VTHDQAERIERGIAGLTEAIYKLRESVVLVQDRQRQDLRRFEAIDAHFKEGGRVTKVEEKAAATDKKLEQWINRGIGAWALAASILAALKYLPLH
jgi:hypothetical protein